MTPPDQLSPLPDRRVAVLLPAVALLLFIVYCVTVHALGWLRFDLGPVVVVFGGLAALNFVLAVVARRWTFGRWLTFAYEATHAALLTVALHYLGGARMGIYVFTYGFLVIHGEVLSSESSAFLTANFGALCYAALATGEGLGWFPAPPVLDGVLTPGQRFTFVGFAFFALNFLAANASRHAAELRRLAAELGRMLEERTAKSRALEAKDEELRAFLFTVTHDLRDPLGAVRALADIVRDREGASLSADAREDLERIARLAQSSEAMVRDLVDLCRVTWSPEQASWVDLDALVSEVIDGLRPHLEAKHVRIAVDPLPRVWGQPRKLGHVVSNLIANAVKYVPAERGTIAVHAAKQPDAVVLAVEDNGIGIPPVYQQRIFELFGRVPEEGQTVDGRRVAGTGVGLAIVKRIVEAHQGSVWVESASGAGSRFFVRLPDAPPGVGESAAA
jgi:signal transduction histidine kinase